MVCLCSPVQGAQHWAQDLEAWRLFVLERSNHQVVEPSRSGNEPWNHQSSDSLRPGHNKGLHCAATSWPRKTPAGSNAQTMPQPDTRAYNPDLRLWEYMGLRVLEESQSSESWLVLIRSKTLCVAQLWLDVHVSKKFSPPYQHKALLWVREYWTKRLQIIVRNSFMGKYRIRKSF